MGVMEDQLPSNKDLIWDLGNTDYRQKATDFVRQFENRLCVFSSTVEQLYTKYSMFLPDDQARNLIIIPDPYAFHDTFNYIDNAAISTTSLYIVPGEVVKKPGLYIMLPGNKAKGVKPKLLPMSQVLALFVNHRPANDPFLPVLVKGDLKPFNNHLPCLHLHRFHPDKISGLSPFAVKDAQNAIISRLEELASYAKSVEVN